MVTRKTPPSAAKSTAKPALEPLLEALDASQDEVRPDASPDVLCLHAETLATHARLHAERLKLAKLAPDTADRLEALSSLLRHQQTAWMNARASVSAEDLKTARAEAEELRGDLYAALRFFASDQPATQRALDAIAEGEGDADTLQDLHSLLQLAERHADALVGTDLPPEKLPDARRKTERFQKLLSRASSPAEPRDDSTEAEAPGQGALSVGAIAALKLRNRAFWALAALDRQTCAAGRYLFRKEASLSSLFAGYVQRSSRKSTASKG